MESLSSGSSRRERHGSDTSRSPRCAARIIRWVPFRSTSVPGESGLSIHMYAGTSPSIHGGSSVARCESSVRRDVYVLGRPANRDLLVSRLPRTNSSVDVAKCWAHRGHHTLAVTTNRMGYQGLAVSWRSTGKHGPIGIGREMSIPCEDARQPRGRTICPTWTVGEAQEAVPSRI